MASFAHTWVLLQSMHVIEGLNTSHSEAYDKVHWTQGNDSTDMRCQKVFEADGTVQTLSKSRCAKKQTG